MGRKVGGSGGWGGLGSVWAAVEGVVVGGWRLFSDVVIFGGVGGRLGAVVGFCWMVGSLGAVRGEERVVVDVLDGWSG